MINLTALIKGPWVYVELDPDTVDMGKQFFAKAYEINGGDEWLLWSAVDSRPVYDRVIYGQKTAPGWRNIHHVMLMELEEN